jgi:hypothetical protein
MFESIKPVTTDEQAGVVLDFSTNVKYSTEMLVDKVATIDNMDDREVYNLVLQYYEDILTDIFTKKDTNQASKFIPLFTTPKFIIALTQVMYAVTPNDVNRRRLNKMSYDYLILKDHDKDSYVVGLLMALSKTINRDKIPKLCTLPLPEDLAAMLALSRYSSEKEHINVKRLNRVLMQQPLESITEQKIVDIFLALFSHVLPLFSGVMLDVVSSFNLSSSAQEIYGLITLAILDIMNELPINDIKRGLVQFDKERQIQYPDSTLRINLESCSEVDYPRLLKAIDSLKSEGIYISTR